MEATSNSTGMQDLLKAHTSTKQTRPEDSKIREPLEALKLCNNIFALDKGCSGSCVEDELSKGRKKNEEIICYQRRDKRCEDSEEQQQQLGSRPFLCILWLPSCALEAAPQGASPQQSPGTCTRSPAPRTGAKAIKSM
ncbi:hypothetical protein STEG23_019295 [Scotinomys teguina]